jgi:hypothetical protein
MRSPLPVRNPRTQACLARLAKNLSNRSRILVGFVSLSIAQVNRIAIHSKVLDPHHLRLDPYKGGHMTSTRPERSPPRFGSDDTKACRVIVTLLLPSFDLPISHCLLFARFHFVVQL